MDYISWLEMSNLLCKYLKKMFRNEKKLSSYNNRIIIWNKHIIYQTCVKYTLRPFLLFTVQKYIQDNGTYHYIYTGLNSVFRKYVLICSDFVLVNTFFCLFFVVNWSKRLYLSTLFVFCDFRLSPIPIDVTWWRTI